jgi:hypothetical protein
MKPNKKKRGTVFVVGPNGGLVPKRLVKRA